MGYKDPAVRRAKYAENAERERAKLRAYRKSVPEKNREWAKRNYERHRAARIATNRRNYDPDRQYYRRLARHFGIGVDQYLAMLAAQGGVCAVCRNPEASKSVSGKPLSRLALDHDHETGAPRGLLCSGCNKALGYLDEDPARIRSLATYVEAHRA